MTRLTGSKGAGLLVSIFILLILVAIAYQPVMFNFFCSDDFYIVGWLNGCTKNPSLLFQAVYEGTPYYRPVLNALLFLEYLLCGANGVSFRLVSLAYLLITAIVLWFLLTELSKRLHYANKVNNDGTETKTNYHNKDAMDPNSMSNWRLFSVGLFLLYPLHTEPINWFVSTTELLANLFIISSFLFYLSWRRKQNIFYELISYVLAIFAFLTKEIAVILPAVLFVYELFMSFSSVNVKTKAIDKLFKAVRATLVYWFLLIAYLCLRKLMTGKFIGSWSNVVFHFTNNETMVRAWLDSLKMMLMPLSVVAFNHHHEAYFIWIALIIVLSLFTIDSIWKNRNGALIAAFLVSWFFICLIPMLKLLWIIPDLLNARYGYIASIPLCALLMYGLAFNTRFKVLNCLRYPIFIFVLISSCYVLRANNIAWAGAGTLTNNLLSEFRRIHREVGDNVNIYFINIPLKYNGVAIAGLKCIESMNGKPFLDKDYSNCIWLLNNDRLSVDEIVKRAKEKDKSQARFYYFNMEDEHFHST